MTAKSSNRLTSPLRGGMIALCFCATTAAMQTERASADTFARIRVMANAGAALPVADDKKQNSQTDKSPKRKPAARTKTAPVAKVDPKTEELVLQMIKAHLPEINQMVDRLRKSDPPEYQRAIRDLSKSVRRLEFAKKRDEALFEIEVQLLKARSNVNLLTARLKVRDTESSRKALRKAAGQLIRAETARDEYEIKVLEDRLANTKRQIDALKKRAEAKKSDSETLLEKNYAGYLRKAGLPLEDSKPKKPVQPRKKQ